MPHEKSKLLEINLPPELQAVIDKLEAWAAPLDFTALDPPPSVRAMAHYDALRSTIETDAERFAAEHGLVSDKAATKKRQSKKVDTRPINKQDIIKLSSWWEEAEYFAQAGSEHYYVNLASQLVMNLEREGKYPKEILSVMLGKLALTDQISEIAHAGQAPENVNGPKTSVKVALGETTVQLQDQEEFPYSAHKRGDTNYTNVRKKALIHLANNPDRPITLGDLLYAIGMATAFGGGKPDRILTDWLKKYTYQEKPIFIIGGGQGMDTELQVDPQFELQLEDAAKKPAPDMTEQEPKVQELPVPEFEVVEGNELPHWQTLNEKYRHIRPADLYYSAKFLIHTDSKRSLRLANLEPVTPQMVAKLEVYKPALATPDGNLYVDINTERRIQEKVGKEAIEKLANLMNQGSDLLGFINSLNTQPTHPEYSFVNSFLRQFVIKRRAELFKQIVSRQTSPQ